MKTITVGFSRSTNIFSKIIMWATNSQISHSYIRLPDGDVYQASGLTVNEATNESFAALETVYAEISIEISEEQFATAEAFRLSSLGKPYSITEIVGFGWVLLARVFHKKVANPFKTGNQSYVCSKLAAIYAGVDDSAENLTPEDLYEILVRKKASQGS